MKLFVDGTVFEYDVQGRQSEAESSNDFADFGFFLDISSQSQVAAYREMGQQTLGKRPCPQVRGGFAIVAFYFNWWQSTEGLRSHNNSSDHLAQDAETYLHDNDLAVVGLFPEGSEKAEKICCNQFHLLCFFSREKISRGSCNIIGLFSCKLMMLGRVEHQIISIESSWIP